MRERENAGEGKELMASVPYVLTEEARGRYRPKNAEILYQAHEVLLLIYRPVLIPIW